MSVVIPSLRGAIAVPGWAKNELWRKARAVPSLDLRFADSKSLVDATTGSNLVTFTRASSGTFVGSDGQIKTATTNLLLRSEEFNDASIWTTAGSITRNANADTAPNGTLTADQLIFAAADTTVLQAVTIASGISYAVSIWIKGTAGETIRFTANGIPGGSSVTLTGGWTRYSFVGTSNSTSGSLNISTFAGATARSIYLWGAQLEQSSSVGEYIPTTSTINSAPRFDHNPTTGESLGLLVEEQRTNLLLNSENIDGTGWAKSQVTSVLDATTSPNGLLNADKLIGNTVSAAHHTEAAATVVASTQYTFSVYLKAAEETVATLWNNVNGFTATFNLANGTVTSGNGTISSVGNGWYRCSILYTPAITSGQVRVYLRQGTAYAGDNASGLFIWGAQLEAGAFPTSYIPTTTATVTRSADVCSISGSNFSAWYRQDEGTVFSETQWAFTHTATVPSGISATWEINNTATPTNNYCLLGNSATTVDQSQGRNPTVGIVRPNIFGFGFKQAGVAYKTAFSWNPSVLQHSTNSLLSTALGNTVAALMATHDRMLIGQATGGSPPYQVNGTIRRLTYWPTRLSNSTLQAVTQ